MPIYATLCCIICHKKVLLIKKFKGLFGGGKWNGLGGKIRLNESPEQACVREVFEESGLKLSKLRYHGFLKFWFGDRNELDWVVHVSPQTHSKVNQRKAAKGFCDGQNLTRYLTMKCGKTTNTGFHYY